MGVSATSGEINGLTFAFTAREFNFYPGLPPGQLSHHLLASTSSGVLGTWNQYGGVLHTMTSRVGLTARAYDNALPVAFSSVSYAQSVLHLEFDELVQFRMRYILGFTGGARSITPQGWTIAEYSGSGEEEFVTNRVYLIITESAGGGVVLDAPGSKGYQSNPDTATIAWSIAPIGEVPPAPMFPGQTPNVPITIASNNRLQDDPANEPANIAGSNLTFPVIGDIGQTGPVFVGLPTTVVSGQSTGALVTGYDLSSKYSPMTSFNVPVLPAGAEGLTIDFGSGPQSIVAGQQIDFGPTGIEEFVADSTAGLTEVW